MNTRMTISDPDWTIDGMIANWADSEEDIAEECADTEAAYLINNTHVVLPGWEFTNGVFEGPALRDAVSTVMDLLVEAADYVISMLDEIREEFGADHE